MWHVLPPFSMNKKVSGMSCYKDFSGICWLYIIWVTEKVSCGIMKEDGEFLFIYLLRGGLLKARPLFIL